MSMFSFFVCVCSAPVTSIDLSSKSILASCGMDRFVYFVDTRVSSFVFLSIRHNKLFVVIVLLILLMICPFL